MTVIWRPIYNYIYIYGQELACAAQERRGNKIINDALLSGCQCTLLSIKVPVEGPLGPPTWC